MDVDLQVPLPSGSTARGNADSELAERGGAVSFGACLLRRRGGRNCVLGEGVWRSWILSVELAGGWSFRWCGREGSAIVTGDRTPR